MAFKKMAGRKVWRGIPVAFKVLALCAIALVALLLILPAPPERDSGGVTAVDKHVPQLRDTVDPLANSPLPSGTSPPATVSPPATQAPASPAVPVAPPSEPQAEPVQPEIASVPETQVPQPDAPPDPSRKPENAKPPAPGDNAGDQQLPWAQENEQASLTSAQEPPEAESSAPAGVPSRADIRDWLRSQAWEFLGGVDAQGNILYRFEVWLEAPQEVMDNIKSVSYVYDAPSAMPESRDVDRSDGGFRARFGSLACSKNVTITVTMADGKTRQTTADGCRALNQS